MNILNKSMIAVMLTGLSLPVLANQVNLNEASKDVLMKELKGLTSEQADAIIKYRKEHGAFVKVPELLHIGIGADVIEPNYNKLTVGGVDWGKKKES